MGFSGNAMGKVPSGTQRTSESTDGHNSTLSNMRAQNRQLSAKRMQDLRWNDLQGQMSETMELRRKLRASQTAF
jgi:hypothetical protein